MKLALNVVMGQDDQLIFAQQLGVEEVFVAPVDWGADALESRCGRRS